MKGMKIYFLYYLLRVVVGLPDFSNLPSFKELLNQSLSDGDICSDVTSYACISPSRIVGISKNNYLTRAQSFIRRTAINFFNKHAQKNNADSSSDREDDVQMMNINRESVWFSACMGRDNSAKNSLLTLKKTMEKAEGLQDPTSSGLPPWQDVVKIYARDFKFSPFFDVVLDSDYSFMIKRPYSLKMKSYRRGDLPALIHYFVRKLSNEENFTQNQIRDGLNATAATFLSYLNSAPSTLEIMDLAEFSTKFDIDFDWKEHFKDIGLELNDSDDLYCDADYFKLLKGLLVKLRNAEIANLIHFLYAMNSRVFSTWHRYDTLNKYSEEECFLHMPFKSGIVNQIVNDHLESRLSFIKEMLKNIIEQYEEEINNSWMNKHQKSVFLDQLQYLEIKIFTDQMFNTIPHDVIDAPFYTAMDGLKNIINFEKAHNKFKLDRYRRAQIKHITQINRKQFEPHFVPYVNYNIRDNLLEIPLEELFLPLFGSDLTIAWNYAYFGVAISRELFKIHQLYSLRELFSKLDCFKLLQYPETETLNFGNLINSCVGLKIAYKAFEKEINLNQHNRFGILRFVYKTRKQQIKKAKKKFFIAYSAIYCEETNAETVRISVSNIESFAKTFKCEAGSPMNPSRRCDFWAKPE